MRDASNYNQMTKEQLKQRLMELGGYTEEEDTEEAMRQELQRKESTRYLMYWEDGATLANHGYILYLVATIYDAAIHLTDIEYRQKYHLNISVQSKVEQPQIYIIARSSSSDAEQLLYSETRRDDLPSLALPVKSQDGREYNDILRFFKGDNPARQFEIGQQRGGHYPCPCGVNIGGAHSYHECCAVENPAPTLQDRQEFILDGPVTRLKASSSLPNAFDQLTKEEMQDELTYRGAVPYESVDKLSKKELQQEMKRTLQGVKRAPALLQPNPTQNLTELNLQHLEVPACESMHDIYNHIKNILEELPAHVPREIAETIQTVKQTVLGDKDTVRASDMRRLLLILTKQLEQQGKASKEVMELLYSLAEVQRLCYAAADDRTTTTIYRLSNTVFKHHLMMKVCFPGMLTNITNRKLWGQYIHSLRDHTPILYRIAPISSLMAENEERHFATIKRITKSSGNYADEGQLITNVFVKSHFNQDTGAATHQDNQISEMGKLLPQSRTRIPITLLKKYARDAQTHCERVADFMQDGYNIHWHIEDEDVVFHDSPAQDPPSHPPHHFRSSSCKQELQFLQQKWKGCLQDEVPLPLSKIWVYEGQNLARKVTTPFLDTGHLFNQKYHYMAANAVEEPPQTNAEEDQTVDQPDSDEMEDTEDEEVIRMDRLDPEPELEQFEAETEPTWDQADSQQTDTRSPLRAILPSKVPGNIRSGGEIRGQVGSCLSPGSSPVSTPPRTPVQEAERSTGNYHRHSSKHSSFTTPTMTRSVSLPGTSMMTPPATPSIPAENKSREESKWQTKLGSALAVVLGDLPVVKQADKMKAKMKMAPKSHWVKEEYNTCVAQVSCHLSRHLDEARKKYAAWEKHFLVDIGRVPTVSDARNDPEASALEKRIRYAEHLLRHFGVHLYRS
ncbi:uncharacterized protein LOC144885158 [Branchiostoma floridae x Branchiostoma japonicum]